jgi:hypothetical protein
VVLSKQAKFPGPAGVREMTSSQQTSTQAVAQGAKMLRFFHQYISLYPQG